MVLGVREHGQYASASRIFHLQQPTRTSDYGFLLCYRSSRICIISQRGVVHGLKMVWVCMHHRIGETHGCVCFCLLCRSNVNLCFGCPNNLFLDIVLLGLE